MSSICLNCFLYDEVKNNIFLIEIDNNSTVDNLKDKIKNIQ